MATNNVVDLNQVRHRRRTAAATQRIRLLELRTDLFAARRDLDAAARRLQYKIDWVERELGAREDRKDSGARDGALPR